jgi:phosphoglycerate kinase
VNTIGTADFQGKNVLIRVDFNVPLNEELEVADDTRIQASLPTIRSVIEGGGIPVLMSHLGRPKNGFEDKFSLGHLAGHLQNITGNTVHFANDCIGEGVKKICQDAVTGEIVLLENLRFHPEEKEGNQQFAANLSGLGEIYINDAFGTAHRAHASTGIIADYFPGAKMFGHLMQKELDSLDRVLDSPQRPVTAILGGAKIAGKIDVIHHLLDLVDNIIIGGGMSYTFIKAQGGAIGNSLVDPERIEMALEIIDSAANQGVALHLPGDSLVSREFSNESDIKVVDVYQIPEGWIGLDIGPKTTKHFEQVIGNSKTIVWNGPMGVFEMSNFDKGTRAIALAMVAATTKGAFSLVGGGDSVAAINAFGLADKVSYVSTGGGALLEYMEGKTLPGVAAIVS